MKIIVDVSDGFNYFHGMSNPLTPAIPKAAAHTRCHQGVRQCDRNKAALLLRQGRARCNSGIHKVVARDKERGGWLIADIDVTVFTPTNSLRPF